MRILIDECLDWRVARALPGHHVASVQKMGWSGITNGRLLAVASENGFDVFLTGDQNLAFQQNIKALKIAVVVLEAQSVQLRHTNPLMTKLLALLPTLGPGTVTNAPLNSSPADQNLLIRT